jgi:hypothetical protein
MNQEFLYFDVQYAAGVPNLSEKKYSEYKWVSFEEFLTLGSSPEDKEALRQLLKD